MKYATGRRIAAALVLAALSYPAFASGLNALDKKLSDATLDQDIAAVNTLLGQGARPTPKDTGGEMTPFQGAIYVKNATIVAAMIKAGAHVNDPDPLDSGGETYLMFAIDQGGDENLATVKALIAGKADVNAVRASTHDTPLSEAKRKDAKAVIAALTEAGATR